MKEKNTFTRETLEKIHSESGTDQKKGRKTGRIILVIDAIVIVLILLFFFGRKPETVYKPTDATLDSIQYRLSVTATGDQDEVIFSLSLTNRGKKPRRFPFKKYIGKLTVYSHNQKVFSEKFKLHAPLLVLAPGDSYAVTITCLRSSLHPAGDSKKKKNRGFLSLFGKSGTSNKVNALAEIYLDNILALNLNFTI